MAFLNSDDLGATAQNAFARLCTSSKIVENQSRDRDRTGWDFRIEFPNNELATDTPLDHRDVPAPIMVQVKAILKGRENIQLNLKTLERFAKLSEPAIICILEFEDADTVSNAYYIHLIDQSLAAFLKKLTKMDVDGKKLNTKNKISFSKKKYWKKFEFNAAGLRNLITNEIVGNTTTKKYAQDKNRQLKHLGYTVEPYLGNFTLLFDNPIEYSDFTLGLTKLKAKNFKIFEERFGYKRQISPIEFTEGEIELTQPNKKKVLVHIDAKEIDDPLVLEGDLVIPAIPQTKIDYMRFLIEVGPLTFDMKSEGNSKISINQTTSYKCSSDDWVNYLTALMGICYPECHLKLTTEDMAPLFQATVPSLFNLDASIIERNTYHLNTTKYLQEILKKCGGKHLTFTLEDIMNATEQIRNCYASFFKKDQKVTAEVNWPDKTDTSKYNKEDYGAYSNFIQLGDFFIAYICYMKTNFFQKEDKNYFSGKLSGEGHISVIQKNAYKGFINTNINPKLHKIQLLFSLDDDEE